MLRDKSDAELRQMLASFCQRYKYVNRIAQKAREEIDRVAAPDFSVFRLFKWDEMVLSKIIAELLSPSGSHGQGSRFLELFIQRINDVLLANTQDRPLAMASLEKTIVTTEAPTIHIERSQRRIDIVVANQPHWALGIENKPRAGEQEDQLPAYQKELDNGYPTTPRRHTVYISGYCAKSDTAKNLEPPPLYFGYSRHETRCGSDHAHLVDWLDDCASHSQSDKLRHFLLDFAQWVRREFIYQIDNSEKTRRDA